MLSPRKPIFAFSKRMKCGWHDTEGYALLHPRLRATRFARAFDLSGRAAVGILPRIFTELGADFHMFFYGFNNYRMKIHSFNMQLRFFLLNLRGY